MFDPLTRAFVIPLPIPQKNTFGSRHFWYFPNNLIEIWHKDPCKDGSDSSCFPGHMGRPLNPERPFGIAWKFHIWHWRIWFPFFKRIWLSIRWTCSICEKRFNPLGSWGIWKVDNKWHHERCVCSSNPGGNSKWPNT